ncbi:MAG: hypothetical protein HQL97_15500 [Magnetococcales bacterium]|nr:hypothetical protein [Magnetococcales bacterium]
MKLYGDFVAITERALSESCDDIRRQYVKELVRKFTINQGETMDDKEEQYANGCGSAPQPAAKKRYVRHVSGKGEKWEVMEEVPRDIFPCRLSPHEWCVRGKRHEPMSSNTFHFLPKSEYELVPPVKRWVDVTKDCFIDLDGDLCHDGKVLTQEKWPLSGYRMRRATIREFKGFTVIGGGALTKDCTVLLVEQEQEVPDGV